jgi:hypothetical protein
MVDWLAVIVICASGDCAFWSETKVPYRSQKECEARVFEMSNYFREQDIKPVISVCLPIKFTRT